MSARHLARNGFKRRGVSLIELATTVGAVTMLASMLLPTLGEARRQGKEVQCLHNLGQIAEANALYASMDPGDNALPVRPMTEGWLGMPAYAWGGKSGQGDPITGEYLDSRWGTANGLGPSTRPLNQIIYGDVFADYQENRGVGNANWISDTQLDLDVYRCPADYGYTGIHYRAYKFERLTSFDHFGTSYSANIFWIAGGGPDPNIIRSNSPYLHRLSEIVVPARTLLYEENCGRFAWMRDPDPCPVADGIPGEVRGWHGQMWTFNVAFVDGHAGTTYIESYTPREIGRYPCADTQGCCDNMGCWVCVLIRGDGWQKDTLPLPDVRTDHPRPPRGRPSHEGGVLE